ncbi:MAG: chromate transporter [Lachnospiraceae bacterium]|nr:chromate transporter [Lachnospiraceae bacterium]
MKKKTPIKPTIWNIYKTFFRVGAMTFGGGYAMLPIIEREVVDRAGWVSQEEIMDYFALGQCTPGVIAVNTATFTGRKIRGKLGAIAGTVGVVTPSFFIILIVAALVRNFAHIQAVQDALAGIRICVCVLIFEAVTKMWKSAIVDKITLAMYILIVLVSVFFDASPVIMVVLAAIAGLIIKGRKSLGGEGTK